MLMHDSTNIEAVHFLAVWYLDRHGYHQVYMYLPFNVTIEITICTSKARRYFGHLATLCSVNADVWLCLSVCCAMSEEFAESLYALKTATNLIEHYEDDVRVKFCHGEAISDSLLDI